MALLYRGLGDSDAAVGLITRHTCEDKSRQYSELLRFLDPSIPPKKYAFSPSEVMAILLKPSGRDWPRSCRGSCQEVETTLNLSSTDEGTGEPGTPSPAQTKRLPPQATPACLYLAEGSAVRNRDTAIFIVYTNPTLFSTIITPPPTHPITANAHAHSWTEMRAHAWKKYLREALLGLHWVSKVDEQSIIIFACEEIES